MTKKVAISTWCTDDYVDLIGLDKLHNSIKHFHPEIDHVIVDSKMTKEIEKEIPWMKNIWMMAPSCLPLANDYDMVIHLDGDAVVTGPLDEMINSTAEIIGVRNNNSLNQAGAHNGITIRHMEPFGNGSDIPLQGFINAGMIAAQGKDFWEDWHDVNSQVADVTNKGYYNPGWGDENDTLNQIFHSDKYNSEVIDPIGSGVSYGLSNVWGTGNNHWESWSQIYVKDDRLYLNDMIKEGWNMVQGDPMCIKVLHQAGGSIAAELNRSAGGFRNWMKTVVSDEVKDYLEVIENG
tara:strand:- start:354 stop:1229 length:876 start_codon:yes stop_codon:yes gene_type:complete